MNYLLKVAGQRTVPIEVNTPDGNMICLLNLRSNLCFKISVQIGENYLSEGWGQNLMTLTEFIKQHMTEDRDIERCIDATGASIKPEVKRKGYLAQHPLFDQVVVHWFCFKGFYFSVLISQSLMAFRRFLPSAEIFVYQSIALWERESFSPSTHGLDPQGL